MVTHRGGWFWFPLKVFPKLGLHSWCRFVPVLRPYPWPPVSSVYTDKPLSMTHTQGRPSANFVLVKGNTLMGSAKEDECRMTPLDYGLQTDTSNGKNHK